MTSYECASLESCAPRTAMMVHLSTDRCDCRLLTFNLCLVQRAKGKGVAGLTSETAGGSYRLTFLFSFGIVRQRRQRRQRRKILTMTTMATVGSRSLGPEGVAHLRALTGIENRARVDQSHACDGRQVTASGGQRRCLSSNNQMVTK